jgi:hypothetical protein
MNLRHIALGAAAAAVALTAACGGAPQPAPPAGNAAAPAPGAPPAVAPGSPAKPKVVRDEAGPDNSHILVRQLENGDQTSIRRWDAGPIEKVTRRQHGGKIKAVRIKYRDGKVVRVEDRETIDHALDWTAAQIDAAATKSGKVVEAARGAKPGAPATDEDDEE